MREKSGSRFHSIDELMDAGQVVGYRIRGTSMEPEYPDGSLVFVDRTKEAEPGDTVVAWTQDGGVIKRLEQREGRLYLAGNTEPPILVDTSVQLDGVVVKRLT